MKPDALQPLGLAAGPLSTAMRRDVLNMVYRAKASHVGSCFSSVDVISVLYGEVMKLDPKNAKAPGRDRFLLSKGHAAAAVYAAAA